MNRLRVFVATLAFVSFLPLHALGSSTRTIDADVLKSSDHTKTFTLPSATTTLIGASNFVQEVPSGTVNGSNTSFTLANTPGAAASVLCHLDGLVLTQGGGNDYTISGATITMATAPATSQTLWCYYVK